MIEHFVQQLIAGDLQTITAAVASSNLGLTIWLVTRLFCHEGRIGKMEGQHERRK